MPLKLFDFDQVVDMPHSAIERLAEEQAKIGKMQYQQLEGAPLLCAGDDNGTAICFNPLIRLFAFAQMFNQTVMYDQWLPIGSHTVAGGIRIYQDKKLLVQATGTVEAVKTFPAHFMEIPDTPSQPEPDTRHKATQQKNIDMSQERYGNVEIAVSVDEKGHISKAEVVDSDDKHLDSLAHKIVHSLVYAPQMENGQPAPFNTVVYLTYYPFFDR
jgi:TonB family protein